MINPYAIIGALVLLIAVALGGVQTGRKLEREKWQAEKIKMQADQTAELAAEFKRYERMVKFDQAKARKASEDHAKQLSDQKLAFDDTVARKRADGGLRIDRAACEAKDARAPATASAGRLDGAAASAGLLSERADRRLQEEIGSVRLPTEVENDLFDLVEDADKATARLRNLQKWVRDNGLYGETDQP